MTTPVRPVDVPPYQLQKLIANAFESGSNAQISCAQAYGSEIYIGCNNGQLLRYALQADDPDALESYTLLSRQVLPGEKPIEEIVLLPSLNRALVLSDYQIYFYTIPSLDSYPIKPIRHAMSFAVDDNHLRRPPASSSAAGIPIPIDPVDFCVVKRNGIAMYSLKDRLFYQKEIPLPQGALLARRSGKSLCMADRENYNIIDLENASLFPILPVNQAQGGSLVVKPSITVVGPNEFLILSWTGASTIGIFITGDGDPVRGTLEWPSYPEAISLDYPYITSLLPNNTIEIHSIETQVITQVIGAPPPSPASPPSKSPSPIKLMHGHGRTSSSTSTRSQQVDPNQRIGLISSVGGYLVPSTQRSAKMKTVPVKLLRT